MTLCVSEGRGALVGKKERRWKGRKQRKKEGWKGGFQPAAADVRQCLSPEARLTGDSQHNRLDGHQRTSQ